MRILTYLFFFIQLTAIHSANCTAQDSESYFASQKTAPFQKLYLHADREFYFQNDSIWFSAYLVDGQTHVPLTGNCNLYVELIDSIKQIVKKEVFLIQKGHTPGWLAFSDTTINEGDYLLRAYTDYLKNFGAEVFYTKRIKVLKAKNSSELTVDQHKNKIPKQIHISFYPEGGFLLAGKINPVAFKAVDKNGNNVSVTGEVVNENGRILHTFRTMYNGMGMLYLIPKKNQKIRIKIDGYPDLNPQLPEIRQEGSKILVGKQTDRKIAFTVLTDDPDPDNPFYLAVMHRGLGIHYTRIESSEVAKKLYLSTRMLNPGINRLILLNLNYEPLSERMIFYEGQEDVQLNLNLNKNEFSTREKVVLQLEDKTRVLKDESANLSIVVLDENAMNASGINQNIKSYLLIDSELCGPISAPADYFISNKEISSETKLDLLMMVNGWKNYTWNHLRDKKELQDIIPLAGITVDGILQSRNMKKNINNAEVTLGLFTKDKEQLFSTTSGVNGYFRFNNIQYFDSATIIIQGKNAKYRTNTSISLQNYGFSHYPVTQFKLAATNPMYDIPVSAYRAKYLNEQVLKEFYPDKNSRIIKDIDVYANKKEEPDGHFRFYGKPSVSLKVEEKHHPIPTVFDYLSGRVAGLRITYKEGTVPPKPVFSMRGGGCVVLIDGFPATTDDLLMLSMFDIDIVDIIKGGKASIFGMSGAYGAINILTKRFKPRTAEYPVNIPGTIVKKIKGFSNNREFYSPKYNTDNITSPNPDFRTTLYWNPKVELVNGQAQVSFFTCDNITRYKIFVEGISETGKICLGEATLEVNKRNNSFKELSELTNENKSP